MQVFFLKSLLSIVLTASVFFALFTMFEVFGRAQKRYDIEKLKKIHRANGIFFALLYIVIAYFCLDYLVRTKAEPSARAVFHGVFALSVLVLLALKVSFVRFYRLFYGQVKTIGLLIALLSLGMMGTSAGYYLLITKFGADVAVWRKPAPAVEITVRADPESIGRGKELYDSKCYLCHDPGSNRTIVGPGHKGILKNPVLPVSKRPATPENVFNQMRNPYEKMPSFDYLSDGEALDIIAYLNTL